MVCELHFEVKTVILVIAINTAPHPCQIVVWHEHGQHCVRRLNDYVSVLSYWRRKRNKTKLNSERLYNIRLIRRGSFVKRVVCKVKIAGKLKIWGGSLVKGAS